MLAGTKRSPNKTRFIARGSATPVGDFTESRMRLAVPTKFNRKSGVAQWRDLQFSRPLLEMFFDRA
jgi:hypothetical protein